MKKDNKKALYESIMASVAKEVKKALNERYRDYNTAAHSKMGYMIDPDTMEDMIENNWSYRLFLVANLDTTYLSAFSFCNDDIDVWDSEIRIKFAQEAHIPGGRETAKRMKALQPGESFNVENVHILCIR